VSRIAEQARTVPTIIRAVSAACLLALAFADGAGAGDDEQWLSGTYGNAPGCAWAKGGDRDADDSLAVLRPDGFETYVMLCDFVSVQRAKGAVIATALCGHEGEDLLTAGLVIIRDAWDPGDKSKRVTDEDGNEWATVVPCG
jgi:hypothetical protein